MKRFAMAQVKKLEYITGTLDDEDGHLRLMVVSIIFHFQRIFNVALV